MGYTTKFTGKFEISPPLSMAHAGELKLRHEEDAWDGPKPRSYCQWVPTKDRASLVWDGGEKFYNYEEWLDYLVNLLAGWGYVVTGSVTYQGESREDRGALSVVGGKVVKGKARALPWSQLPGTQRDMATDYIEDTISDASEECTEAMRSALALLREHGA